MLCSCIAASRATSGTRLQLGGEIMGRDKRARVGLKLETFLAINTN